MTTSTKDECRKGFSCGTACIARSKSCESPIVGKFKQIAQWLGDKVAALGDLVRGKPKPKSKPEPTPEPPPTPDVEPASEPRMTRKKINGVPDDVSCYENEEDGSRVFLFDAGKNQVTMNFGRVDNNPDYPVYDIAFSVNDEYQITSLDQVPQQERDTISRKLRTILNAQIENMGNGELQCGAHEDSQQGYRAYAYTTMGFSRPEEGVLGAMQYAVVKGGKIDPLASQERLKRAETELAQFDGDYDPDVYQETLKEFEVGWTKTVEQVQRQRKADRAAKRSRAKTKEASPSTP